VSKSSTTRLGGIDALRGIAALLVLGLHARAVFGGAMWFGKGYLAVDFFLVLSGFLMVRTSEPRLAAGLAPLRFMVQRYRRMWGMVALGSAIGTPYLWLRSAGPTEFLPVFFANLALIPYPFQSLLFALNIPAWTVFFELVANAAHVTLLRHFATQLLAALVLALLAATIWVGIAYGSLDVGPRPSNFLAGFPRVFFAYTLGMLLARVWREEPPLPVPSWLALAILPAGVLGSHASGWTGWSFDLAFVLVACPLAIFGGWRASEFGTLGKWSAAFAFPLFAIHLPILEAMRELGVGLWPAVATALGAAIAVTWWTTRPKPISPSTSAPPIT
jgi:peptidoglycan/LPS O-acetylase OafA/YrhL